MGKLAREIRSVTAMGSPGDTLMRRIERRRNQGDRLPVDARTDFDFARAEAQESEAKLFQAIRNNENVQYRTMQELAVLRQTVDRVRAWSDIQRDGPLREQQMRMLLPGLQDLGRRATLIQYNDALTDELLTTVENYATFWANNPGVAQYLQRQQPPTLWQQLQLQERKVEAMLKEIQVLLPQTARVAEARLLRYQLNEDATATALNAVPVARRGSTVEQLLRDFPALSIVPESQRSFTPQQLIGDNGYRTLAEQVRDAGLVADMTRETTLRAVFERRLQRVEKGIRDASPRVAEILPSRPAWETEAYGLLQQLVFPQNEQAVGGRRVESQTLQQLRDRFRNTNAPLSRLYELLPVELRNVKMETIRADIESRHFLRAGVPEERATALEITLLPEKTSLKNPDREVDTVTCTIQQLSEAYPNQQVLMQFCQLVTPQTLAKRLRDLSPAELDQLRSARLGAYSENIEKRSRDMFRIGQVWTNVRGQSGTYETRVANNMYAEVLLAKADSLCDQIFTSGNAGALPTLMDNYKSALAAEMTYHQQALSMNAQVMSLVAIQRHFGPMTRLSNFNRIRLNPREVQALQRNLPPQIAAELDAEWERYGVGLTEYLDAIQAVVDKYADNVNHTKERIIRAADHIAQKLSQGWQLADTVTWALPDLLTFGRARGLVRAAGATWVVDRDAIKKLIEDTRGEFVTLRDVLTNFQGDSLAAQTNVRTTVEILKQLVEAVPPKDLAASETDPVIPDIAAWMANTPAWLRPEAKKAYQDALAVKDGLIKGRSSDERAIRIASDRVRNAEQAILRLYLAECLRRYTAAKAALEAAKKAGLPEPIERARTALDDESAYVSGLYLHLMRELEDRDLPAVQTHVRALMDSLAEKVGFHAGRFHEYDQVQTIGWSALTGLGATYLTYNIAVRPVLQGLGRGIYNRSLALARPTFRGYLPTFTPLGGGRLWNNAIPWTLETVWNNTVGRIPGLNVASGPGGRIPASGSIDWARLNPEVRTNYLQQLGREVQEISQEAARLGRLPASDATRAKALAALEQRAVALQERMAGLGTIEYRQLANNMFPGRTTPLTEIQHELMYRAHLHGGNIRPDAAWSHPTIVQKQRILMGIDPEDPTRGMRLNDGTRLNAPARPGEPATFPEGHPRAGQPAGLTMEEARQTMRTGMAGERTAAAGTHVPNPRSIALMPRNANIVRGLMTNPNALFSMTRAEMRALIVELRTLNPNQAKALMDELKAAARTNPELARALQNSRMAQNMERLGAQAAGELGSLRFVGMAVFEVAVLAFQIYMFVESVRAWNKALDESRKSIEEMKKQVVAAGFYDQGNDSYHHPTLNVTINLKDLERGLGAEARERWWSMITAGGGLAASTAISVLSMTSVIGGPVTIALMVGVVIVEFIINKVAEKVKEREHKEFLAKCPAWLLMALGTIQTVHDTPDGFLKKLELGRDGIEESAARKLVFMIWLRDLQRYAPETYRELTADLTSWDTQQKFFDEQFTSRIYPEWKRCLFMRRHGRRHSGTLADDNLTAELVRDYYLCEYLPIADMIRTQAGANQAQIRQAVVDSAVGALPGIRLNRQWQMQQQFLANGDSFVGDMDPPVQLSALLATSGSARLPELQARTATAPGFRMGPTLSQHIETWVSKEFGTWLLKSRFGSTDGAAVDVGGGEMLAFAFTNGKWQCNRRGQPAQDVSATLVLPGLNGPQQARLRTIALGLLRSDNQQPDEWLRREYGRVAILRRPDTAVGTAEGELNVFVRTGVSVTFAFRDGQWKWKQRADAPFQALTIAPTLDAQSLANFREVVQDIMMIDVPVTQATMRVFLDHCKTSNLRPLATIGEPAMYVNAPEELYEFIEDPIVRMRTLQAGSGVRGTRDTVSWAPGHRPENADQAFAVQTLIRGNWGIPRALLGNDALGSAIRYERAGGLFANDGEQPHMRRITTATQELLDSMQSSERRIQVGVRPELADHIFSAVADPLARPLVMSGERRRQGPIPNDDQLKGIYKTITDHTLTNDMLPANGPDRVFDSIRSTFSRRNLRGVVFESAMFNEGERRNSGYNQPGGEEDVFVVNALFVFHDGQRQYTLRRGVVCRRNGDAWRPVYGAAMADTQQSLPNQASRHLPLVDQYRRYDVTNSVMRRFDEASLRENAPAQNFTAQPQLSAQLFPGRSSRPLIYVRPQTVPMEVGTPAYDLVRRLVERQEQDHAMQLENPAAYFIEFRDTVLGAGGVQQQGAELITGRLEGTAGENGEYLVRTGEEPNVRSLALKCVAGTWKFKNASNQWVSVQQDVAPADVGNDRVAAGHFNRNVLSALRSLRTRQTLEALSTIVPTGELQPGVVIARQGAVATCQSESENGAWNTWTVESGARINRIRDGAQDRSMWLRDARSIRNEDVGAMNEMLQRDRRADVDRVTADAIEQLVAHHRLNSEEDLPDTGYADLPPVNGSQRLQLHRTAGRTVLFQERLPSYDARAVQTYLRFDTTDGPRLWPLRGVQFASIPNDAALQPHRKLIEEQRRAAAQSWGVNPEQLTLSYYLSPSAQGNDSFLVAEVLSEGRQYGFASAQQIMELQNFSARREILSLLTTPVYRQVDGVWAVDGRLSIERILRQFPVELADGLDCRNQLTTALLPLLERAPDKQIFLRRLFDVLYANGTIHRTSIQRIAESPLLRQASTTLLLAERSGSERTIPLSSTLFLQVRSGFPEGSMVLSVVNKNGEDVEGATVRMERVPGGDAAATVVNPAAAGEGERGSVYTLASLRGNVGGVVHISVTQSVRGSSTPVITRVPVELVTSLPGDTDAVVEASRTLVQPSGPRELMHTQGEGFDSRTVVLRQSSPRRGSRNVNSQRFGTLLNFSSSVVLQQLNRNGVTEFDASFDTIGYLRAYPPVPRIEAENLLGVVSASIGEEDGQTLQARWNALPAALRTYARREPLELSIGDLSSAAEKIQSMIDHMDAVRQRRDTRLLSPREQQLFGLLNEMDDELSKMKRWTTVRSLYTTPRQTVEPGVRGFNRSEFEAPIQDLLNLYLHDRRNTAEDAPSANRRRFVTNIAALYRTLNPTQRQAMLTRIMNSLDAAALQRIRSANNLSEEDLRMFAVDSSTLETIRAGEYLRVRHNATERDGVYTVTLSGKAVEFTFREGMMHYRKSGAFTWKDITQPLVPADVGDSAAAANAFNADVFPDLLAGLDFLPREILNRIYGETELRRMPGVTEANGIFSVPIDGKTVRVRFAFNGWEYISTRPVANEGEVEWQYRRGFALFERLNSPPVAVRGNVANAPITDHIVTVRQQGARAPQPALEYRMSRQGWQFKAAGNVWKSVAESVAAADVGGNAVAATYFTTQVSLGLQNWVGAYVPVPVGDVGGDQAVADRFTRAFSSLSRNYGNLNGGVLSRIRGVQFLNAFSNPKPTEAEGVITLSQQGIESPKQLRLKFQDDQWKYRAAGENVWKGVHEPVIAEDVDGSATAAEYFNTTILPRLSHSMLRRTSLVAAYEQMVGASPDEYALGRLRMRSQSPFYQPALLARTSQERGDNDDADDMEQQPDDVATQAPGERGRYFVRYLNDSSQYLIVPEQLTAVRAPGALVAGTQGPVAPLRFGVRNEGDTQTEWITINSLSQLSDPSIPNMRRTLMRRMLTTPQPQFVLEQLPAQQQTDARALRTAIVARQSTELSLGALNRHLATLPTDNRRAREQVVSHIEAVLAERPSAPKSARLNVAGSAIELVDRIATSYITLEVADRPLANDLRAAIGNAAEETKALQAINKRLADMTEGGATAKANFVAAIDRVLELTSPSSPRTIRLTQAGNAAELAPRRSNAIDSRPHRASLSAILNLCTAETGDDEAGVLTDFREALLQLLEPMYVRAVRKDVFLERVVSELETRQFVLNRDTLTALRRNFQTMQQTEVFVPRLVPGEARDIDLGGCILRVTPNGRDAMRFQVITPLGAPRTTALLLQEERADRQWGAYAGRDGVLPQSEWGKLLCASVYVDGVAVVEYMPIRIDHAASNAAREKTQEELLRSRLTADTTALRTEATRTTPNMLLLQRMVGDINNYLPQVKDDAGSVLNTATRLLAALGSTAFPSGKMTIAGQRGLILPEVVGAGTSAAPQLRLVSAAVLRGELTRHWQSLTGAAEPIDGLRARIREFNARLEDMRRMELPFLTEDYRSTMLAAHPGYRLLADTVRQQVTLAYAPQEALPTLQNSLALPERLLSVGSTTTIARTEPGPPPEDVSVTIAVEEDGDRPPRLRYTFSANVEGANDAAKLRDVGVTAQPVQAQSGDAPNALRVAVTLNTAADRPGSYAVTFPGATALRFLAREDLQWMRDIDSRDNRGQWIRPRVGAFSYLCQVSEGTTRAYYRANGETRERLTADGLRWEPVPETERAALPALPAR